MYLPKQSTEDANVNITYKDDAPDIINIINITNKSFPKTYEYFNAKQVNALIDIPLIDITLKLIEKKINADKLTILLSANIIHKPLLSNQFSMFNNNNIKYIVSHKELIKELISIISPKDFYNLVRYYKYKTSNA